MKNGKLIIALILVLAFIALVAVGILVFSIFANGI